MSARHKIARSGVCASFIVHALAAVALAAWSTENGRVQFAGRRQVIQLTVSVDQPRWSPAQIAFDFERTDAPVVIKPTEAHIAKRRYVHIPTTDLSEPLAIAELASRVPPELPRRASLDEAPQRSEQETRRTSQSRLRKKTPADVPIASAAAPPSPLGNTEETPPDLTRNAPPNYPALAIGRGWEGTVLLQVWIDAKGGVTRVEVARSSGYEILDGAAANAVKRWKATPARRGDKPVATVELLPVQFKL